MPDILSYYAQRGGIINALIFCACVVTVHIGLGKWFLYRKYTLRFCSKKEFMALLCSGVDSHSSDWLVALLKEKVGERRGESQKYYTNRFRQILLEEVPVLEKGLHTMAAWIGVAPLLGLFGTVAGMIRTFSNITEFGMGNPVLLSEGISVALLTTQAGLLVAFPCLLFHNYLRNKKNIIVTHMIAEGEQMIGWLSRET